MSNILTVNNVSKDFNGIKALKDVSISLDSGKIIGLLGPNGSGKTTLIKLMSGLLTATKGELFIDGKEIGTQTKEIVSYLPDKDFFDASMKVSEIINYYSDFYKDFDVEKAYKMISDLQIQPTRKIKTLSKGNKEKVSLVLVMCRNAKLYILDEPIAGVDPAARDYILNTIISNFNTNATIIISTHLIADIEPILNEAIFIKKGEVVLFDSVDNIRDREKMSVDELFREVFKC